MSRALARHVLPVLREAGFGDATGRRLWRHDGQRTDHIEIASLSSYRALTDNATTASFHVNLAISLPGYGFHTDPYQKDFIKSGPSGPRPRESQMPIRGVLCPPEAPPLKRGRWGWEWHPLWRVETMDDADKAAIILREQLESYALEWMERAWDSAALLELLVSKETTLFVVSADNGSHLRLNAELPGSPIRQAHIAMMREAIKAGK